MKTFYITYWANKHKKHITRQGKHDDKSRFGTSKPVLNESAKAIMHTANPRTIISSRPIKSAINTSLSNYL